jgi:hypothetical protein
MQSSKRNTVDVVVHWPAGPVLDGSKGSLIGIAGGPPPGELRSYLRELALGRR